MTKKQLREHKQGNQERKALILTDVDVRGKRSTVWFCGGVIQNGKYTRK